MKEANPQTIYLKDYQPPAFLIGQVNLRFDLKETGTRVFSEIHIQRNPQAQSEDQTLFLNGEGLRHCWVKVDGELLADDAMQITEEGLTLLSPPDDFVFSSEVEIAPENNTALEGLYRSSNMFCTQCEAEGFRKITWFLDRPDVMARFHVRIEADKARYPVLLSNGNPGVSGDLADGRHFAEWDDPIPKPCYLFALVAGDLRHIQDKHITPSGREVDLRIYVEQENIDKCDHAMRSLKHAMHWDEEKYGREYDLDVYNIVAVNDFNMGAMENKGLNIFNSKFVLARPDTATDSDFQGIEGVIAHEYFHNWTGNRITCRDWFQLSLKEGLTVYRDQEFSADMGSRSVKRIEDVRLLRAHQFAEDASPMAHPVRPASYIEINNFYTVTVYEKGAEVVRMQANLLGAEQYRKATDLYFARHDGQAVTTEDFVTCMADVSGRDFSQFQNWYDYAGTPHLNVQDEYDAGTQTYCITFKQHVPDTPQQSNKPAFHIPIALGLLDAAGQEIHSQLIELYQAEQSFVFEGVAGRPTPSILRGFSAPVKIEYPYTDGQLMHLMAHDSDGFNRWDAAQTLLINTLLRMVEQRQAGQGMQVPDSLIQALRSVLLSGDVEPALIAEVLSLPSINYVGDFMSVVDVDSIFLAREMLRQSIAQTLREDLFMIYERLSEQGEYQITHEAIGQRRLKNVVLGYLLSLQDTATTQLAIDQYGAQHNMTDVIAALALIADSDAPIRDELLADFAQRWQQDPLVMDKWFSVQAVSTRKNVLGDIQQLMQHPAFSINNPNKVRALIGTFANNNPLRFHAADGSGYRFIAAQVKALDKLNPQIAARLLRSLARWQRYDDIRQKHAQAALQDILAGDVSKDVYEIADKSLQAAS
jgi:aminopeptidase N